MKDELNELRAAVEEKRLALDEAVKADPENPVSVAFQALDEALDDWLRRDLAQLRLALTAQDKS